MESYLDQAYYVFIKIRLLGNILCERNFNQPNRTIIHLTRRIDIFAYANASRLDICQYFFPPSKRSHLNISRGFELIRNSAVFRAEIISLIFKKRGP